MRQETRVVGVAGGGRIGRVLGRALRALGDGTAGVVVADESGHRAWRPGDPTSLADEPTLDALGGVAGIGEIRHGQPDPEPFASLEDRPRRPHMGRTAVGSIALAVSGGLVGRAALVQELLAAGALLSETDDNDVLAHLLARSSQRTPVNRVVDAFWNVRGGFAAVVLAGDALVGIRDPRGIRPLLLGQRGEALMLASEASAIEGVGGQVTRSVAPGEMVILHGGRVDSVHPFPSRPPTPCVLDRLVLASASTEWGNTSAWSLRQQVGRALAAESELNIDGVVVAMPNVDAVALGFAEIAGLPLVPAFAEGRPVRAAVVGRRVTLIALGASDGIDTRHAVGQLLAAGAAEVHVHFVLAPATHACLYGVQHAVVSDGQRVDGEGLAAMLGATGAAVLTPARLHAVLGDGQQPWCLGCVSGVFPEPEGADVDQLGLFGSGED